MNLNLVDYKKHKMRKKMLNLCRYSNLTSSEESANSAEILFKNDSFNCSNFLDVDWLSSSGNSCEDETFER